jgi:hypothetical protein
MGTGWRLVLHPTVLSAAGLFHKPGSSAQLSNSVLRVSTAELAWVVICEQAVLGYHTLAVAESAADAFTSSLHVAPVQLLGMLPNIYCKCQQASNSRLTC